MGFHPSPSGTPSLAEPTARTDHKTYPRREGIELTDPIETATAHAVQMYPEATITTRSVRGRPVVLATIEGAPEDATLTRIIRLTDLDAPKASEKKI